MRPHGPAVLRMALGGVGATLAGGVVAVGAAAQEGHVGETALDVLLRGLFVAALVWLFMWRGATRRLAPDPLTEQPAREATTRTALRAAAEFAVVAAVAAAFAVAVDGGVIVAATLLGFGLAQLAGAQALRRWERRHRVTLLTEPGTWPTGLWGRPVYRTWPDER